MFTLRNLFVALTVFLLTGSLSAQVRIVATVEGHKGAATPPLTQNDMMVYVNDERMRVTGWEPVGSDHAALQLWVLIDAGTDTQVGSKLDVLIHYILGQPSKSEVGVEYLHSAPLHASHHLTHL